MSKKERLVLLSVLTAVLVLVLTDLLGDSSEGVDLGHLLLEGSIATFVLFGIFYVLKDSLSTRNVLLETNQQFSAYRVEAEKWRLESRKYVEGLSTAIDQQLIKWGLTPAEKEVAFLLLKGLSLKEIADVRSTSEKTSRVQSMAIYSKARLAGRSELSAFFLEDLLVPQQPMTMPIEVG